MNFIPNILLAVIEKHKAFKMLLFVQNIKERSFNANITQKINISYKSTMFVFELTYICLIIELYIKLDKCFKTLQRAVQQTKCIYL